MSFLIEVEFKDGLTDSQMKAFEVAAKRWSEIITGDLPNAVIDGKTVDDLLITAEGADIDGSGAILGQAGPEFIRTDGLLPITGMMQFDKADLKDMEDDGSLVNVIVHEMGHVIGIGTLWEDMGLLEGAGTNNPEFTGPLAMRAYAELLGESEPKRVPVENTGGPGTADGHWRETTFANELMTGFLNQGVNPLSLLTAAALEDMGYTVNREAANEYSMPTGLESFTLGRKCGMTAPIRKRI